MVGRLHPRLELRSHVLRHFGTASCGGKLAGKWHGSASLLTTAVTRNGVLACFMDDFEACIAHLRFPVPSPSHPHHEFA